MWRLPGRANVRQLDTIATAEADSVPRHRCAVAVVAPHGVDSTQERSLYWWNLRSVGQGGWTILSFFDVDGPGGGSKTLERGGVRCQVDEEWDPGDDSDSAYVPSPSRAERTLCWRAARADAMGSLPQLADSIDGGLYPIGWSRAGLLAYVERVEWDPAPTQVVVTVRNLVTDEVIWTFSREMDEGSADFHAFWREPSALISQQLGRFRIDLTERGTVHPGTTLRYQGRTYSFEAVNTFTAIDDFDNRLSSSTVAVSSPELGRKVVFTQRAVPTREWITNAYVAGAIVSPFEPRAAVIYVQTQHGFEGAQYKHRSAIGAHLTVGFGGGR
ncbi:MAG: hypothetical protein HY705_03835 [Gemmatimonadetes bacterium]|nr:hypothetical protein [Gemmatimonadota bacterium]